MPKAATIEEYERARGVQLMLFGLDGVEFSNEDWLADMRKAAARICRKVGAVSVDDLRAVVPEIGQPSTPNAWGAIFRGDRWKPLGRVRSRHQSNHGRMIAVWVRS